MSDYYQQQGGQSRRRRDPAQEPVNQFRGIGIVRPRSGKDDDPIQFWPFKGRPGGAIHFMLVTSEMIGNDESGQPKTKDTYHQVTVMTNKSITQQQLEGIRAGMKVRVVGPYRTESFKGRDGNQQFRMVVQAFVLEVLEMPQQIAAPAPYAPQGQQYPTPQGQPFPASRQGGQPFYGQQPGYQQGWPQQQPPMPGQPFPAPQQGGQQPFYGQQPGYQQGWPPLGAPQQQPPMPAQPFPAPQAQQTQQQMAPPYYKAPAAPPQAAPAPGAPAIDDLPPDIPV